MLQFLFKIKIKKKIPTITTKQMQSLSFDRFSGL
jgi:hypothetical protein